MKPKMTKPTGGFPRPPREEPWVEGDWEKEYPYLYAFLSEDTWDDGTLRVTGTLLVFLQDGVLKGCLNDRGANRSSFLTAACMQTLFDAFEAGLEQSNLVWRERK